jgi:hypothetical protein
MILNQLGIFGWKERDEPVAPACVKCLQRFTGSIAAHRQQRSCCPGARQNSGSPECSRLEGEYE